ncbi:hypothetical protein [Metabacillus bambusae]|nr:hypothetical protein [Metabacillus bambusae]
MDMAPLSPEAQTPGMDEEEQNLDGKNIDPQLHNHSWENHSVIFLLIE